MRRGDKAVRDFDSSIEYHDLLAAGWSARYLKGAFARRLTFFAGKVLPELAIDGCWLDAGCGSGVFTRMLATGARSVVGVDASSEMITSAIQNTLSGGSSSKRSPPSNGFRTIITRLRGYLPKRVRISGQSSCCPV